MSQVYVSVSRSSSTTEQLQTSSDGVTWVARSSPIDTYGGTCIDYGHGRFVALGLSSADGTTWIAIVSTDDGVTWTSHSIPQPTDHYVAIAYSSDLGVWIGLDFAGDVIKGTADGSTWTYVTTLDSNTDGWTDVEWGQGKFVAFGADALSGACVALSTDGDSWATQTAVNSWWQAGIFAGGQWVAVGGVPPDSPAITMSSPDATSGSWTSNANPGMAAAGIDYDGSNYIVSDNSVVGQVFYSADGLTFTALSVPDATNAWRILHAGGQWLIALQGTSGSTVITSADGLTGWTLQTTALPSNLREIAYSTCPTVACGSPASGTTGVPYSHTFPTSGEVSVYFSISSGALPPGLTLDPATGVVSGTPTTDGAYSFTIRIQSGQFVMANDDDDFASQIITTSPSGHEWTRQTTAISDSGHCIAYGPDAGVYVMGANLANTTEQIQTSSDAETWTARSSPADTHQVLDVKWGGGQFMAVWKGGGGSHVMTSPTGTTWTARTIPDTSPNWIKLAYAPEIDTWVVIADSSPLVMVTTDGGASWTELDLSGTDFSDPSCIAWGAGLFVVLQGVEGSSIHLFTTPDGFTWTQQTDPNNHRWTALTYGNARFVATSSLSTGDRTMRSIGGISWNSHPASAAKHWDCVAYGAGLYAAGANNAASTAAVMTSADDAVTWASETTPSIPNAQGICWGPAGCSSTASCSITVGAGVTIGNTWRGGMQQRIGSFFG